ncbi:hypothetical protein LCGC14_0536050 [marine sediment metagenome]|uniref:Uncharacterized protein n=1 Tax=marine sediment metagenome TaxID=412755 RepID=A0A0F9V2B2_9ZZZZ
MQTKHCPKCETNLPVDEFGKDHSRKDDLQGHCKKCRSQEAKTERNREHQRKYYRNNRDRLLCQKKKYQATEKGREVGRQAVRKYRKSHRKEALQYSKKYNAAHQEEYAQRQKEYRATFKGHLCRIFHNLNTRCNNPKGRCYKNYGGRGIENRFESVDEFGNHVIDDLGITSMEQIKGLQIHRKDNDGHYEVGNIEFLTPVEHAAIHVRLRKTASLTA